MSVMSEVMEVTLTKKERLPPNGWRWVKLRDVTQIIAGQSPPGQTYRKSTEGLPFFQGKADFGLKHPVARTWCVAPKKIAQPGDILMSVRAPVGPTNVANVECCIGRGLAAIRCNDNVDTDFILSALKLFESHLANLGSGSTFSAISRDILENLELPLPTLAEQKRISAILNERMAAVEKARAATEAQLDAAQCLPAAYLRAVFNSPEAQRWSRKPLSDVCEIVAKQVDPKLPEYGVLPHVNGENIEGGTCRLTYLRTAAEEGMTSGKYVFEQGDVLYSKLRPYLRKTVVVDFRGVCSADMYPIRVNKEVLNPHFLAWMLISSEFTQYADEQSRRARMPKLNREQLFAWEAPIPPLSEQNKMLLLLNHEMERANEACKSLEGQLETINKLPAALLRQAFSGCL